MSAKPTATAVVSAESAVVTPPFDALLIELFGTTDTEAYLAQAERRASELVVVCMNEAGFEFQIPPAPTVPEPLDPTSIEDASTDGFGIISGFRQQIADADVAAIQGQDPNVAYLSTLTEAEIQRFFLTLEGVEAEPGQQQEDSGCNGLASDEAYADWQRFSEAVPNYTAMGEERDIRADWNTVRDAWQACMLSQGFDYYEPDAIRSSVVRRMRDTVNEAYPGGEGLIVETTDAFIVDPQVDVILEELIAFERTAAVANVECTAPLAAQFDAVKYEVQKAFVDRNQAAIDALLKDSG